MGTRIPKVDAAPAFVQLPAPTSEKRKQYSVWFLPSIFKELQHESIDREMAIGEILEEAMHARIMMVKK